MTRLLDANVLIALVDVSHVHHERARRWFVRAQPSFATCPITQGALVRHYFRDVPSPTAGGVLSLLAGIEGMPGHAFWPDDVSYRDVRVTGVIGYRQISDAYLAALARKRGGRLATLDSALAALHEDVAERIPD
ncbi:MAG: PIN domain-containing protein [Lentisphaeria bacterium]|nr:PIN domain-containing protein [Lentisphaeria bacterium]